MTTDLSRLLGRHYWMVLSTPTTHATAAAVDAQVADHVGWLLGLERQGILFASGPLVQGPRVGAGSGMTLLRADSEADVHQIAAEDPFVRAGLRTFEVYLWRLNEGSISISVSLGTGTYEWD